MSANRSILHTKVEVSQLENFEKDRNVILKNVQNEQFELLSKSLVTFVTAHYKVMFNPLGLMDSTFEKIVNYQGDNLDELRDIYENLSVAYRYKYGDNQLEIIWDGTSHETKYAKEWQEIFGKWVDELSKNSGFVRGILQLTALNEERSNSYFIQNYIKSIINDYFEIKILKKKGVKRLIIREHTLKKVI